MFDVGDGILLLPSSVRSSIFDIRGSRSIHFGFISNNNIIDKTATLFVVVKEENIIIVGTKNEISITSTCGESNRVHRL